MTSKQIEQYLDTANKKLDKSVEEEIIRLKKQSADQLDEEKANYFWCLLQIYKIQNAYLTAFEKMKASEFENAWYLLDRADIEFSFLEKHYEKYFMDIIGPRFHLVFILHAVKEFQKLFPYQYFFSREAIVKEEKCSICGKPVSLRNSCGHRLGQLYMGKQCSYEVTDIEILGFAIVTDPFDKYSMIKIPEREYNYYPLEELMTMLNTPFDLWNVDELKIVSPVYKNAGVNSMCPCGSGKKFKRCCKGTDRIYTTHFRINLANKESGDIKPLTFYNTLK